MPTVDDLIVSVRIEETSNLGNLQKQLTALVGKKGEKAATLGFGLSPTLKKDLEEIKGRLMRLTPTVLVEGNLKEAAFNLASNLKKDKSLRSRLLERYDINADKYDTFIEELFNITLGLSELNSDQKKSFIAEMDKFRKIADMTKGERKTLITKLTKLIQEITFHKKTVQAFREAGLRVVSKPSVYEVTKTQLDKSKTDWENIIKEYSEKYGQDFKDIKDIFDKNTDTLDATGKAVFKATGEIFDITDLSFSQIQANDRLMMVLVAQVASAMKMTQWVLGEFYKAGQNIFTGGGKYRSGMAWLDTVVNRFTPEAIKQLGLQKVAGDDISTNLRNVLTEYKGVATLGNIQDEAYKRLIQQGYDRMVFVVEESSQQARDKVEELRQMALYKGKEITLMELGPRTALKTLGLAPDLDEMMKKSQKSIESAKEAIAKSEESLLSPMQILEEKAKEIIEDMPTDPAEQREYIKKIFDLQEGLGKKMTALTDVITTMSEEEWRKRLGKEDLTRSVKIEEEDKE